MFRRDFRGRSSRPVCVSRLRGSRAGAGRGGQRWLPLRLLLPGVLLLLSGCADQYGEMADARALYARDAQGPVLIAAIEDPLDDGFKQGIELAVEQINGSRARLLGRPLRVRFFPAGADFDAARGVVRSIAEDPRVSVVIGHRSSSVAIPASVIYERAQVLFLPSFATSPQLTRHGFGFVQRTLPDNTTLAAQTASVVALLGHRRIVVLHGRGDYSRQSAFQFEDEARARDLHVVHRASFFEADDNYRGLLGQLNAVPFDAFYLSAGHVAGARMLRQIRELGLVQPVFASDHLVHSGFKTLAGAAGDNTVGPALYDLHDGSPRNRAFVAAYAAAYGRDPGQAAAQGYDAVQLFAAVVRHAGGTEPRVLATSARYGPPRAGVTGIFAFDGDGNVYGKVFRFRVLRFGHWWPLPGVTEPYRLASFNQARQQIARERSGSMEPPAGRNDTPAPGPEDAVPVPRDAGVAAASAGARSSPPGRGGPGRGLAERDRAWLTLAHDLLGFQRLGLVVPGGPAGSVTLGLARRVAAQEGFSVEVCELHGVAAARPVSREGPLSPPAAGAATPWPVALDDLPGQEALRCWTRLARRVDALLLDPDLDLPADLVRSLNRTLRDFRVPAFVLTGNLERDLGLTLVLEGSGVDLDDPRVALRFDGVMHGRDVRALNRELSALATVRADLEAWNRTGTRPDARLMNIVSGGIDTVPRNPEPADPAEPTAVTRKRP